MKKRVIQAIACLLLIAGCSTSQKALNLEEMSAEEQFQKATEVMQEVTSMEASMVMELELSYLNETIHQETEMSMKLKDFRDPQTMEAQIKIKTLQMEAVMYIREGLVYLETMGMKMKTTLSDEEMAAYIDQVQLISYDASAFQQLQSKKVKEDYCLSYTMDEEAINHYLGSALASLQNQLSEAKVTLKESKGTMTIDSNAQVKQVTAEIVMDFTLEEETMSTVMTMIVDYDRINETEVSFPENLEEYTEY